MPTDAVLDPAAVTFLDDPFELVPVIRDILRTRYCVPGSVFLVEGLDCVSVSQSGRWQAVRLLLGDGALCIQALLPGSMHRFVETGEISLGSYIRCENLQTKWQQTDSGAMVYLVVEDLVTVGWNDSYRARAPAVEQASPEVLDAPQTEDVDDEFEAEAFEAFEAVEALAYPKKAEQQSEAKPRTAPDQPIALPRDWHDPQTPLKLTTLRSIPHLPYAQNWSCNVLAILASLSPVEPSNLAPHRQRTARLADPSTSKQVHLTVFLDPDDFSPQVGSVVLLVGVKNHRFDGGSLKKYASDRGGRWWFQDPVDMGWCDVEGIKTWWKEMTASQT